MEVMPPPCSAAGDSALKGRHGAPPLHEVDLEEAAGRAEPEAAPPFSRQISPRCRLVDCTSPSPTCRDGPDITRLEFGEFRRRTKLLVEEYFCALDMTGMVASITALGCPSFHDELAASLLRAALDRGESERQAVVTLLVELEARSMLTNAQLVRGFEKLVIAWDDIQLDVPDAPGLLVAFLSNKVGLLDRSFFARLPEELLQSLFDSMKFSEGRGVLASHLADMGSFKVDLAARLREDLFHRRSTEALAAWLRATGKPAYHHEVITKACIFACGAEPPVKAFWTACLDSEGLAAEMRGLVLKMLVQFHSAEEGWLLDEADVQIGFSRVLGCIRQLDAEQPGAADQLVGVLSGAVEKELLPAEYLKSARRMRFGGAKGVEVVRKVQRQTPMYSRRVWGSGDARQFRAEVQETILEFFDCRSTEELAHIVQELHLSEEEQAHFLRKLLVMGMEREEAGAALDAAEQLIGTCWSLKELQAAFDQLRDIAKDLVLDFPYCRERTSELVRVAAHRGLLDQSFLVLDGTTVV